MATLIPTVMTAITIAPTNYDAATPRDPFAKSSHRHAIYLRCGIALHRELSDKLIRISHVRAPAKLRDTGKAAKPTAPNKHKRQTARHKAKPMAGNKAEGNARHKPNSKGRSVDHIPKDNAPVEYCANTAYSAYQLGKVALCDDSSLPYKVVSKTGKVKGYASQAGIAHGIAAYMTDWERGTWKAVKA